MFGEDVVEIQADKLGPPPPPPPRPDADADADADDAECVVSSEAINDLRAAADFRGATFSNHSRTQARTALLAELTRGRVEPACYWCAEFVCAGAFEELWTIFAGYMGKVVHLANPKLPLYLELRHQQFRALVDRGHFLSTLELRNHPAVRRLFAEVAAVLALSVKAPGGYEVPRSASSAAAFGAEALAAQLRATDASFALAVFDSKEDP